MLHHGAVSLVGILLALPGWAQQTGNATQGKLLHGDSKQMDCLHGDYDAAAKTCRCYDGWAHAGITDTVEFAEGVCDQYHCQSDAQCQQALGIEDASCPVSGWDCYCGWQWAISNSGHGWETHASHGGAACMGIMYTFSIWMTHWTEFFVLHAWKAIFLAGALCLPFGRKRMICDHHSPSLWRGLLQVFGCPPTCHGQCLTRTGYTSETLKDDFAWSLYIVELGAWFYVFLAVGYAVTLLFWLCSTCRAERHRHVLLGRACSI